MGTMPSGRHLRVWQVIERHATDPILGNRSLKELSQESDVSVRTLYNVCHAFTGLSAKAYIRQRRLKLALEMLRKGQAGATTVTNIATFCGFSHLSRFANNFRDQHGQLPSLILRQPPQAVSERPRNPDASCSVFALSQPSVVTNIRVQPNPTRWETEDYPRE
jgi:AraC-like DNA-binding protein